MINESVIIRTRLNPPYIARLIINLLRGREIRVSEFLSEKTGDWSLISDRDRVRIVLDCGVISDIVMTEFSIACVRKAYDDSGCRDPRIQNAINSATDKRSTRAADLAIRNAIEAASDQSIHSDWKAMNAAWAAVSLLRASPLMKARDASYAVPGTPLNDKWQVETLAKIANTYN